MREIPRERRTEISETSDETKGQMFWDKRQSEAGWLVGSKANLL